MSVTDAVASRHVLVAACCALAACTVANPDFDPSLDPAAGDSRLVPLPAAPSVDGGSSALEAAPPTPPPAPTPAPDGVDLLVVVDNSSGMAGPQSALGAALAPLVAALEALPGGLRLGVVTTDLGVGAYTTSSCSAKGHEAKLRVPKKCTMFAAGTSYLESAAGKSNVSGSAAAAASCLVQQGTSGCGFEQPLEAMRRALEGNPGFLRPGAALALILLTTEDDCSAASEKLFDWNDSSLGPYADFRCFQHGVLCGGKEPSATSGSLSGCVPGGSELHPVKARYVDFVTALRPAPRLAVLTLAPPAAEPYQVSASYDIFGYALYQLKPSCQGEGDLRGLPALRLASFSAGLGAAGLASSVCDPFSTSIAALTARVKAAF